MNITKAIVGSKYTYLSLFFLFIQQIIVASSTIWIAELSQAVIIGQNIYLFLILFVSSLFIVYLPGIAANYYFQKSKNYALKSFTELFIQKYFCNPCFLNDTNIRQDKEGWLTSEGGRTIEEVFTIGYDAISVALNTSLNVLALYYVFGAKILIGYLACILVLPLVSYCFRNILEKNATQNQEDRKNMYHGLLSGWDNTTTGNIYNFQIWWRQFLEKWQLNADSSIRAIIFTQLSSIASMIFSLIPVSVNFIYIFLTTQNINKQVALIATLPRQIQIMQHFEVLTTYIMHWHGTYARFKNMIATIQYSPKVQNEEVVKRISWKDIYFKWNQKKIKVHSFEEFIDFIEEKKTGRIIIEGKNGSGKTSLINLLKQEMKESIFYLPTHNNLLFEETLYKSLSTGQKIKSYISEIAKNAINDYKILLLDEWDANLDPNNVKNISTELDILAKTLLIIEISHHQLDKTSMDDEICGHAKFAPPIHIKEEVIKL